MKSTVDIFAIVTYVQMPSCNNIYNLKENKKENI
jgi:hypothetical protein